jgi:hypothetical protein
MFQPLPICQAFEGKNNCWDYFRLADHPPTGCTIIELLCMLLLASLRCGRPESTRVTHTKLPDRDLKLTLLGAL